MSMSMDYESMRSLLQKSLKPSRYEHSLGVAETAAALARRFGVAEEQARVAGLLHDCAREFPNENLIAEAEARQIVVEPVERQMP
ncbi:MAG: HD domain-containing protein, partial [Selenomonas sp.]|nr:HD domain-containing protein [Selenomonas sp.]